MTVNIDMISVGLADLAADAETQLIRWTAEASEVASFVEAVENVFDDSGLSDSLQAGPVFGREIDQRFEELQRVLSPVDPYQPVIGLVADPNLAAARTIAGRLLTDVDLLRGT